MIHATDIETDVVQATHGDIAVINLNSAKQGSWSKFWRDPTRPGAAELIVEQEQLTAQFTGDLEAFDRLERLVDAIAVVEPKAGRTALIAAQVAGSTHRFAEARLALAHAVTCGAPSDATDRLSLSIDQATGSNPLSVLAARRERAAQPGRWGELVPLAALLADLGEFDDAERTYLRALREYPDVSPFALAWVCFQLGMLWGELVPEPETARAIEWYRRAAAYLPGYVKARIHLAELLASSGRNGDAEALLVPVLSSGDPEVRWRLADVLAAQGRLDEAKAQLDAARSGFEDLLARHRLAFADHAAEFYAGSGADPERAFELARLNLANRPTLRAFEQAHATALAAGEPHVAAELIADACRRWGSTSAFRFSPLAMHVAVAASGGEGRAGSLANQAKGASTCRDVDRS